MSNPLAVVILLVSALGDDSHVSPVPVPAAPREVTVGVYLNQINAVSLHDNQFMADFTVWFRWRGDDEFDPLNGLEVANAKIDGKESAYKGRVGDEH
jgi:hypothetical protein